MFLQNVRGMFRYFYEPLRAEDRCIRLEMPRSTNIDHSRTPKRPQKQKNIENHNGFLKACFRTLGHRDIPAYPKGQKSALRSPKTRPTDHSIPRGSKISHLGSKISALGSKICPLGSKTYEIGTKGHSRKPPRCAAWNQYEEIQIG